MGTISEGFLLTMAQIAATLIGLLLVGGFFYVETGLRRTETMGMQAWPFVRATTKLTLLLYALVLGISLGLVVLSPAWFALLYALLAAALVKTLIEWTLRYRSLRKIVPVPRDSPWITWPVVAFMLTLPWMLDGWNPSREAMVWTLFLAGGLAVWSTVSMLLTSFDLASWERAARDHRDASPTPRRAR